MSVKNPPTPKQFATPSSVSKPKKPAPSGTNGTSSATGAQPGAATGSDSNATLIAKPTPKHKDVMESLLRDMGVTLYDQQLPATMLDVAHKVTKKILNEAHAVSGYSGKKHIDSEDVKFGIQTFGMADAMPTRIKRIRFRRILQSKEAHATVHVRVGA